MTSGAVTSRLIRIDKALVELGLAESRTQAQRWIESGHVRLKDKVINTPSTRVALPDDGRAIQVTTSPENRYVSRGGLKLQAAIEFLISHFQIESLVALLGSDFIVLDIGLSTGGFADCLLQNGVPFIWGVDVGHGQLDRKLQADPRLKSFEGLNARNLTTQLRQLNPNAEIPKFALITIDVSFISLKLVLPQAWQSLRHEGLLIALVKPQFELGASALDKRGVVKDPNLYQSLELTMKAWAVESQAEFIGWLPSPITGGDGNREFLMILKKQGNPSCAG